MEAIQIKNKKDDVKMVVSIIEKMNNDSQFYGNIINTKNLEEFLSKNGFDVSKEGINLLNTSINKIKELVNEQIKGMTDELFDMVALSVSGCNGTGW